jgi:hypothetical protein
VHGEFTRPEPMIRVVESRLQLNVWWRVDCVVDERQDPSASALFRPAAALTVSGSLVV